MRLSVVIPAYNEAAVLAETVGEAARDCEETFPDYDILLVENGSTDETPEIAEQLAGQNPRMRIVRLAAPNYGRALKEGILRATGDWILCANADFWDRAFLASCRGIGDQFDIIVGSKTLPASRDCRPIVRRLGSRWFNFLLRYGTGFRGTDSHGIKLLRKDALMPIVRQCRLEHDLFDTELLLRSERAGRRIAEIPVTVKERRPSRYGMLARRFFPVLRQLMMLRNITRGIQ